MSVSIILILRSLFYFILALGIFLLFLRKNSFFKFDSSDVEDRVARRFLVVVCFFIIGISAYNALFSFFPVIETRELCLDSQTSRVVVEIYCSFSDDKDEYGLTLPSYIARRDLPGGAIYNDNKYFVSFEKHTSVISEIHEVGNS